MKAFITLLSVLLLTSVRIFAAEPLVVGMELSFPPFEMRDQQGEPSGIGVEMAQALARKLDRPLQIQNLTFDGLIPALKTGRIDLIISSMTATPERAQSIDFSEPYVHNGLCLLVGKDSPVQGVDDLNQSGRTVAVKKATTGHIYAAQHLTNARVLVLDKESACALEVAQGKADAFIYDQIAIYQNWRKNPQTTRALLAPFTKEAWAIGIRKGNDDLRAQVNAFIAEFRSSGGFEALAKKYLGEQRAEFDKLGLPFLFE